MAAFCFLHDVAPQLEAGMSRFSPWDVLAALNVCESDLSRLLDENWERLEPRYRELHGRLESSAGPPQMLAAAEVMEFFAPYDAAREKLNEAINNQTEAGVILIGLADLADQISVGPTISAQMRAAVQQDQRQRFIWVSGPTRVTSLKIENALLSFEFGTSTEFLIGLITTATKDVLGEANMILKAAGVLLMLNSLYKATAIKLDEREATVFCGFAKATRNSEAKEEVILAHTNRVRHQVSLKPLDLQELRNALYKLEQIESVRRVETKADTWQIIEQHKVK